MSYEVEFQKLKNKYPDFLKKTEPAVVELMLSDKTAEEVANICEKNGVKEGETIKEIAQRIGWVLLGKLPSGNLAMTLQSWVELEPITARKIADEANQFISSSMIKIKNGAPEDKEEANPENQKEETKKPKKSPSKDVYRELVE